MMKICVLALCLLVATVYSFDEEALTKAICKKSETKEGMDGLKKCYDAAPEFMKTIHTGCKKELGEEATKDEDMLVKSCKDKAYAEKVKECNKKKIMDVMKDEAKMVEVTKSVECLLK